MTHGTACELSSTLAGMAKIVCGFRENRQTEDEARLVFRAVVNYNDSDHTFREQRVNSGCGAYILSV